ncbi:MAG TPA: hypothetical protein GX708_05495 [Gallicola sp.]|nr:hypothetical protein [Gallicola sp.]
MNKKEKILEYLKENTDTLKELVSECNVYDGSLEDYYYWENGEEFFEIFYQNRVDEAVRAVCYGSYEYMDDYVRIDVYGNLDSCSEYQLEKELQDNVEEIFDNWYELYQENNVSSGDNNLIEMVGK